MAEYALCIAAGVAMYTLARHFGRRIAGRYASSRAWSVFQHLTLTVVISLAVFAALLGAAVAASAVAARIFLGPDPRHGHAYVILFAAMFIGLPVALIGAVWSAVVAFRRLRVRPSEVVLTADVAAAAGAFGLTALGTVALMLAIPLMPVGFVSGVAAAATLALALLTMLLLTMRNAWAILVGFVLAVLVAFWVRPWGAAVTTLLALSLVYAARSFRSEATPGA